MSAPKAQKTAAPKAKPKRAASLLATPPAVKRTTPKVDPKFPDGRDFTTYTPTEHEDVVFNRVVERGKNKAPHFNIKVDQRDDGIHMGLGHTNLMMGSALVMDAFAASDGRFAEMLLGQISEATRIGETLNARQVNQALATVIAIAPRDETEALLATQMLAIHHATMTAARRLNHVDNIAQQDSASTMLNKLARTFTMQMDTLKRYRSTGEQVMTVQHVTVNQGGQAIVGDVTNTDGANTKKDTQSHEPKSPTTESRPPLLGHIEADQAPVPRPGRARQDSVQVPRSASRSPQG